MIFYGAGLFWSLQVTDIAYFYSENKITFAVTKKGQEHIIDHAEPYFNGKIVISVLPPYKVQITISEEKLSSFKLWLNY